MQSKHWGLIGFGIECVGGAAVNRWPDLAIPLMVIGSFPLVWGLIGLANDWREKNGKSRLGMEPSYLITIGLVGALLCSATALGGVIWQKYRTDPDFGLGAEAGAAVQAQLKEKSQEIENLSAKLKHFSALASDDDIAKAIAPIRSERDAALSNLKIAMKQRDDLQKQYDVLQQAPAQQTSAKVARYIKLKELLKQAEEARSTLSTFDIHSAVKAWPTNQESLNQKQIYLRAIKPMTDAIQALKNVSNNAFGKTLDLDKSPSKADNPIYKVSSEDDFHDPDIHMEYRRLYFTNENYKKDADSLISQLKLDFASITEAIASTPAGDSATKD